MAHTFLLWRSEHFLCLFSQSMELCQPFTVKPNSAGRVHFIGQYFTGGGAVVSLCVCVCVWVYVCVWICVCVCVEGGGEKNWVMKWAWRVASDHQYTCIECWLPWYQTDRGRRHPPGSVQIGSSEGRDESACHLRGGREVRDYTMYAKEFRQHVIATYLKRHNFDRADFWQKNVSYIIFYKPL